MDEKINQAIDEVIVENENLVEQYKDNLEDWRKHLTSSYMIKRDEGLRDLVDIVLLKLNEEDFEDIDAERLRHKIEERIKTVTMKDTVEQLHAITATGGNYRHGIYFVRATSKGEAKVKKKMYNDDEYIGSFPEFGKMMLDGDIGKTFIYEE